MARFEALVGAARAAARDGSWEAAAGQARAALALWRGEPLADAGSEVLAAREVPRLAELRLAAMEARLEADVHLGGHDGVIGELRRLVASYPLREHLHELLMLALYRDGSAGRGAGRLPACPRRADRRARRSTLPTSSPNWPT